MNKGLPKKFVYPAIAAAVAAICIIIFISVFVLAPQRRAIIAVDEHIKKLDQTLGGTETDGNSDIERLKIQLSKASENLSKYVVGSEQAADLAVNISKIAKQVGVKELRSTNRMENSYGPINECQHVRKERIQINFKSSFPQFAKFVNSLERNQPVIFVDYFKINRSDDNSNLHDVEMVLTFFVGQDSLKDIMEIRNPAGAGQTLAAKTALN